MQQQLQGTADGHAHAHAHGYSTAHHFDRNHVHRPLQVQSNGSPHTPQQQHGHSQYGMLGSNPIQHNSISRLQQEDDIFGPGPSGSPGDGAGPSNGSPEQKGGSHLHTKIVIDPPNLGEWRQKLFDVNEMITLSEEECVVPICQSTGTLTNDAVASRHISLMSTMSIHIGRRSDIRRSHSSRIIGIVD